jgi:hypothetical protein
MAMSWLIWRPIRYLQKIGRSKRQRANLLRRQCDIVLRGASIAIVCTATACGVPPSGADQTSQSLPLASNTPPAQAPESTSVTSDTATATTTATQPAVATPIVILQRSGGITGHTVTFTINGDGTIVTDAETFQPRDGVASAAILQEQLLTTGIFDVSPGVYVPNNTCCDRYSYELTLSKDGQRYHYITIDGAEEAPEALFEAISLIQVYVRENQKKS